MSLCALLLFAARGASAQSSFAGEVKDASGAVLPGVTVEASSPALIEKTRSDITDGQGRYSIKDLRPGVYTLTFSLTGFESVKREGIELQSNFTAPVNAVLKVGTLEETVTVTGESPLVDVQQSIKAQVLSQQVLTALPNGRSVWAYSQAVIGAAVPPDVGGSAGTNYPSPTIRGLSASENIYLLDGLIVSTATNAPQYFNTGQVQEMVYQTSGQSAVSEGGGLNINMIPKEGGNQIKGDVFGSFMFYQGDNFDDHLKSLGATGVATMKRIWDFNPGVGGPIFKDKLWFFSSYRFWGLSDPIPGSFYPSNTNPCPGIVVAAGCQNIDDNRIQDLNLRLTYNMSPRAKLSVYTDRQEKFRGHDSTPGVNPATSSTVWTSPYYATDTAKYTYARERILFDVGYNATFQDYWQGMQPGISQTRGTAAWLAGAAHIDQSLGTTTNARDGISLTFNHRYGGQSSLSYVTGSNSARVGGIYQFAESGGINDGNADLAQNYLNNVPTSVTIKNTPVGTTGRDRIIDMGIYAQDTWTMKRLTVNAGLRFEYYNGWVTATQSPAGRFIGDRSFPEIDNVPNWKNWAPRTGVAYDLRGDGRTALKFSFSKYDSQASTAFPAKYDPVGLVTQTLSWTDLNNDGIAQGNVGCVYLSPGCEINFATLPSNFGTKTLNQLSGQTRPYSLEYTAQVQHAITPRISVNAGWFYRSFKNDILTTNTNLTFADYTPVTIFNPLDGTPVTVYNISKAGAARATNNVDGNHSSDSNLYGRWVTAWEGAFTARLPRGATLGGGFGFERSIQVSCDATDNPNTLLYCDQRKYDVPYRAQFKLNIVQPLPYNIQFAANFDSEPGALTPGTSAGGSVATGAAQTNAEFLQLTSKSVYTTNCNGQCVQGSLILPSLTLASLNIPLAAPGTQYLDRYYLLDFNVSRSFGVRGLRITPALALFNALNQSPVLQVQTLSFTAAAYNQPILSLQARMLTATVRLNW
jgi:hypothetical protein